MSMSPTLSVHATYAGMILGTAAYMSPEQARGKPVDRRTDVWAFGCVLFEMLTGKHAFEPGETVSDAIASVLTREPDLTTLPAGTPPPIRRLLRRCLQKDPQQRLPHIGAARLDIDEVGSGHSDERSAAAVAAPPPAARASLWRRAMPVAAAAVVTGAVAAFLAWTFKPLPGGALTRFSVALADGQTFTNTGRQLVALSPDGSSLVYVANNRLFLRSMSTLEARAIAGSEAGGIGITSPVFSPDGQSLAFWSVSERALKRLAVAGGAAVTICPSDNPSGLSWDEHGIVFGQAKGILRVSPNGGAPEVIAPAQEDENLCCPHMLPSGAAVLFSARKNQDSLDKARIVAQRLDRRARSTLIEGGTDGRYIPTGHLLYAVAECYWPCRSMHNASRPTAARCLSWKAFAEPEVSAQPRTAGLAQFSASKTGAIAYLTGQRGSQKGLRSWTVRSERQNAAAEAPARHLSRSARVAGWESSCLRRRG
jgi:serine/threonine-protein kinase